MRFRSEGAEKKHCLNYCIQKQRTKKHSLNHLDAFLPQGGRRSIALMGTSLGSIEYIPV